MVSTDDDFFKNAMAMFKLLSETVLGLYIGKFKTKVGRQAIRLWVDDPNMANRFKDLVKIDPSIAELKN